MPVSPTPLDSAAPLAIDVRAVRRVYKAKPEPIVALDHIDLTVEPGELIGAANATLLAPNFAIAATASGSLSSGA